MRCEYDMKTLLEYCKELEVKYEAADRDKLVYLQLCCLLRSYVRGIIEENEKLTALAVENRYTGDKDAYERGKKLREEIINLQSKVGLVIIY